MKSVFNPGKYLLVDEIMSAWKGLCQLFTAFDIPHLIKIAQKPEGVGAQMKAVACGESGIILGEDIQQRKERMVTKKYVVEYSAGTAVTLCLVDYWRGAFRAVVVDSDFASVKLLVALFAMFGMTMTGAVKTASKGFPMKWFNSYNAYGTERMLLAIRDYHVITG